MMTRKSLLLAILLLVLPSGRCLAVELGEALLKTVTVGVVVNAVANPADDALNKLLANRNLPPGVSTKVVPVLSVGEKGYVGAVQVAGSQALVSKTKAVLQLETSFSSKQYRIKLLMPVDSVNRVRLRALVPSDSTNPLKIRRVKGVGCTAIIDAMALRAKESTRRAGHYGYFTRAGLFVGPGEDPRYRPPGWDRGRKTGWAKHGDPYHPPGLSKKQGPAVIIIQGDDDDNGEKHQNRHRRGKGHKD